MSSFRALLLLLLPSFNGGAMATAADRIAGSAADPNRFRWFGLVGGGPTDFDTSCAGALIAPDFFLTTSYPFFCDGVSSSDFNVKVGVFCLDPNDEEACLAEASETPPVVVAEGAEEIHRGSFEFDPPEIPGANQFRLLQFSEPIKGITPVVPDDGSGFALLGPSTTVTVVGSGDFEGFGDPAKVLQSADVSVVPSSVCQRDWELLAFSSDPLDSSYVNASASALCTSNAICSGDDGGSVVLEGGASNGADLLLSMVLDGFNAGCNDPKNPPDLTMRTSTVFDWIKEVVCSKSSDPPFWCDDDASVVTCPRERNPNKFTFPSIQNCRWLKKQPNKVVKELCESDSGAASACPVTCSACPSE